MKRIAYGYAAAGFGLTGAYFTVAGGSVDARAVIYQAMALGAAITVVAGIWVHRPTNRAPWYLFAGGLLLWSAGDGYWNSYQWFLGKAAPYPSPAEALYITAYPLFAAGVLTLMRGWGRAHLRDILDGSIVSVSAAVVIWVLLIGPLARGSTLSVFGTGASVGETVGDVLVLAALAQLVTRQRKSNLALRCIGVSIVLALVSDYVYAYLNLNSSYASGMLVDAGWLIGYTLFGAAALHPSMRSIGALPAAAPTLSRLRLASLGAALLTPPVALVIQSASSAPSDTRVICVGAILTVLLVGWRVWLLSREREQVQAELTRQNDRLLELDQMKDELIALVSHELRTPLTSIVGYLELIGDDDGGRLSGEQRRHLAVAERNAQRLIHLVSDLLLTAQLRSGRLSLQTQELDLAALAEECVASATPLAQERSIRLSYTSGGHARVAADSNRLAQVIDNLLSNALKFTPEGGSVDVSVREQLGRVVVEVSDTGIGIPDAEQPKLFTPFFRAGSAIEHAIHGTGLGLSIVKGIVEAHGGTITLSNRVPAGSTFRVDLPTARIAHQELEYAA
jgi:signal transduction histidine kinase